MALKGSHNERIERLEDLAGPLVVEVAALVLLVRMIVGFDFGRADVMGVEPLAWLIEDDLDLVIRDSDPEADFDDPAEWMRVAAARAALAIVQQELQSSMGVEVEIPDEPHENDNVPASDD